MRWPCAALVLAAAVSARPAAAMAGDPSPADEPSADAAAPPETGAAPPASPFSLFPSQDSSSLASPKESTKRFWPAFLEVTAFNVVPNLWNRWVRGKPGVTLDSWKDNLRSGFAYDPDKFTTNQLSHPQQGALYYAAARSNGMNLWESALFTAYGSLTWEYFGEATRPSTNDLIVTTLGGVSAGETSYRLSELVLDDSAQGWRRFFHELAGLAVSPGRVFQRLISGDAWHVGPRREVERPDWLDFDLAGGWIHVDSTRDTTPTFVHDRVVVPMDLDYGNPFERDLGKPFSSFHLEAELTNGKNFVSRVQTEGILAGRRLDDGGPARSVLAATFIFDYLDVDLAFSQQALGVGVFARVPLGRGWDVLPRASLLASFAAVHTSEDPDATTYRNYDYGLGGGLRAGARLRHRGRDVARLGIDELFLATANGPTRWNEVTLARGSAWLPLTRAFSLGAEYTYQRHRNVLPTETQVRTSGQTRVVVSWAAFAGRL